MGHTFSGSFLVLSRFGAIYIDSTRNHYMAMYALFIVSHYENNFEFYIYENIEKEEIKYIQNTVQIINTS